MRLGAKLSWMVRTSAWVIFIFAIMLILGLTNRLYCDVLVPICPSTVLTSSSIRVVLRKRVVVAVCLVELTLFAI